MKRNLLLLITSLLLLGCSDKEVSRFAVVNDGECDFTSLLKSEGISFNTFTNLKDAIESVPEKSGVMVFSNPMESTGIVITEDDLSKIRAKSLRVFIESPIVYGRNICESRDTLKLERIVVKERMSDVLTPMSLLTFNSAVLKNIPQIVDSCLLVAAKVAGFDIAVYGLENTPAVPVLYYTKDGVMVSSTNISQYAQSRYMPQEKMRSLLEYICTWVGGGDEVHFRDFSLLVKPSYRITAKLSKKARRESVDKAIRWYFNGHFLVDSSWEDDWVGKYMGDGTMPVGPEIPSDYPVGDGRLGVLEGHMSSINSDGSQMYRYWMRADVQGESAYAFASASTLLHKKDYAKIADNLLDYSFKEYRGGPRDDISSPTYGLIGWAYTHKGTYYGDDNARYLLGAIGATAYMDTDKYDRKIIEGILANFRTSGTNGFRGGSLLDEDIQKRGWKSYYESPTVNLHPHFESWLWACYLWLYRQTGYEELLKRVEKGISMMMAGYPDDWAWTNGIQQEKARMILPLAWLYRVSPTEQHREWLDYMLNELLKNQVPCGGIREELGDPSKSSFGRTPSNALYGVTEAPLIFDNGDPVSDMLYTTNFAFIGLCEAAAATGDPEYTEALTRMSDFLTRIQVRSDRFKSVDGAWFRAFDYRDWDYWASNADAGWGAWSTLTGWIQSWIVGTQVLVENGTSLWTLSDSRKVSSDLSNEILSTMLEFD